MATNVGTHTEYEQAIQKGNMFMSINALSRIIKYIAFVAVGGAVATLLLFQGYIVGNVAVSAAQPVPAPATAAPLPSGKGYAPLSPQEQSSARDLARAALKAAQAPQSGIAATPRVAEVSVARHEEPKPNKGNGNIRRADVFFYNYDLNTTTHVIVNLGGGTVESSHVVKDMQLPITAEEANQALQLALADSAIGAKIREEYRLLTGKDLQLTAQLQISAGIFLSSSQPEISAAAECGKHRCANLILTTSEGRVLNVLPIVDLSSLRALHAGR